MVDPVGAAEKLARIFPDLDAAQMKKDYRQAQVLVGEEENLARADAAGA